MRLDRFLTLTVFHPLLRMRFSQKRVSVPILMYHSISDEEEEKINPYYRLATRPSRFAEQMQWLHDLGYKGVSLEEALEGMSMHDSRPQLRAAITFDDGYLDFFTEAFPMLQRYEFNATVYLPTGFISNQRKSFQGRECVKWSEVRELAAHGIRFGSHTVNHPKLHALPWSQIQVELAASKESIESSIGKGVDSFSYPYAFPQEDGNFSITLKTALHRIGYRSCVTTMIGRMHPGDDYLRLKRIPINSLDDKPLFKAKLQGAYDWLSYPQKFVRSTKRYTGGKLL